MSQSNLIINSVNTGEVSGLIESRNDLAKYASACKTLENALPLVEGGAKKMPGTYFAGATANGGAVFTGSIAGTVLTVTEVQYGVLQIGAVISGASVTAGTSIIADSEVVGFVSGIGITFDTPLDYPLTPATISISISGDGMGASATVTWTASGVYPALVFTPQLNLVGGSGYSHATATVTITNGNATYPDGTNNYSCTISGSSGGTGSGGTGTYTISNSQTVGSEQMQVGSVGKSRLAPFQFSTEQGAILEFSAGIIRIWEGAIEGSWSLGLALDTPTSTNYNPVTAYASPNLALVGPYSILYKYGVLTIGGLFIAAPYGTSNAGTVPITVTTNSSDALAVTITGASPNQGINIALANSTHANNAATAIQAAIRYLVSLNSPSNNFVDLSAWTVTPDPIYYVTPWILAPGYPPMATSFGWQAANYTVQCTNSNQNDQFPITLLFQINAAYWEFYTGTSEPIELVTPYLEADLFALDCSTQSADVLWVFHPNYPPAVVERLSANSWQYGLSLPGQQSGEPAYRGTADVVKTGYSALGQSISLISQANPCTVVLASGSPSPPFANGSRIYINECSGMVDLNEGEFLVDGITLGTPTIDVIDSAGNSTTITPAADVWYFTIQDPDTGSAVNSSGYLQYAGGGFSAQVIALFNSAGNYPACGTLYQQRLFEGGSALNPTQFSGSVEGDYPNFICDPNEDDYGVQFTLVSNQVNPLLNMVGTPNGLAIGTAGGVWIVASSGGSTISQTNVDAALQNTQGVSGLQPQVVNGSAIFCSRSARIVTFLAYNFVTNQWDNTDLTRLNRNITIGTSAATSGIAQTAFQMEPYPIFWAVRNDGQLLALVFNTQDQVYAWSRVNMTAEGGLVESVAVISGQNQEDQVVVVVNRTIDGMTQRYVEYFMPQELFGQLSNAFFVHSGQQFNGVGPFSIVGITQANPAVVTAPGHDLTNGMTIAVANVLGMTQANTNPLIAWTVAGVSGDTFQLSGINSTGWGAYTSGGTVEQVTNQVTGMSYLLGQNVIAIGDGQIMFEGSVTADAVNFGSYANQVTIGIPFTTTIEPMNPVIGNQQATSKSKRQKFPRANLSLYQSVGGQVGTDLDHLHDIDYTQGTPTPIPPGNATVLFTGNVLNDLDADWEDEGTILIVHSEPFPFTLRSIEPRLSVAEGG